MAFNEGFATFHLYGKIILVNSTQAKTSKEKMTVLRINISTKGRARTVSVLVFEKNLIKIAGVVSGDILFISGYISEARKGDKTETTLIGEIFRNTNQKDSQP